MAKGKDYYTLLGIKKEATEAEIKSAYKKAALKHHPDRGGNADKFKEISEAYEALSDPQKRSVYDQFGEEGLKGTGPMPGPGGGGPPGGNPFGGGAGFSGFPSGTTFTYSSTGGGPSPFGNGPSPFGNFGRSSSGFVPSDPNDIFSRFFTTGQSSGGGPPGGFGGMDLDDDTQDFLRSRSKRRAGPRPPGFPVDDAPPIEIKKPLQTTLEEMYSGAIKKLKITRKLANGISEPKILDVTIKPGYKAGTKITYKGAGNEEMLADDTIRSQDIAFIVEEKPHEKFKRDGDNLIYTMKVSLADALCGPSDPALARRSLTTLDGRTLTVTVPFPDPTRGGTPLTSGTQIKVVKEGFPISKPIGGKTKGDLIINIEVQFPPKISPSQASTIRSALTST